MSNRRRCAIALLAIALLSTAAWAKDAKGPQTRATLKITGMS